MLKYPNYLVFIFVILFLLLTFVHNIKTMITLRKHFVFNTARMISYMLSAVLLMSCGGDDDTPELPITSHAELEQVLNSAAATDITCITAKVTAEMLSKEDYSRYYPNRIMSMWLGLSAEEDYHPDIDGKVLKGRQATDTRDEKSITYNLFALKPSTTYYYNSVYQIDSVLFYGDVHHFTTESAEKYLSMDVTYRDFQSVILRGETLLDDIDQDSKVYLYYKIAKPEFPKSQPITPTRIGNKLSVTLNNLYPNVEYEYWLKGSNKLGSFETGKKTFKTLSPGDYIYVDSVANITGTTADIFVRLDPEVFNPVKTPSVRCGTSTENLSPKVAGTSKKQTGDYSFTISISRLDPNTKYYFVVGAHYSSDTFYTDYHSFVTASDSGETTSGTE